MNHQPAEEHVVFWRVQARRTENLQFELLLARGVQKLGARTTMIVCDEAFSGCIERREDVRKPLAQRGDMVDWQEQCRLCYDPQTPALVESLGVDLRRFGDWITAEQGERFRELADSLSQDELMGWRHHDVRVGEYAVSSALRYFKGADPVAHPAFPTMLREYFYSGLVSTESAHSSLEELQPTRLVMQHGIYVEWGPAFDLALARGVPVTRWMRSYKKDHWCLKTSNAGDPFHIHSPTEAQWEARRQKPMTPEEDARLDAYTQSQRLGVGNRVRLFLEEPRSPQHVRRALNLPTDKPIWAVFCHLAWDAEFGFRIKRVSPTFRDWLADTISAIIDIEDVHWLIKVHPAERVFKEEIGCGDFVRKHFPELPEHVQLIEANTTINTHGITPLLSGGVTIFGTAGLELAMEGKPVILGGQAHYGGKGFTLDSESREQYVKHLQAAPSMGRLSEDQQRAARQCAHLFFLERMIPLEVKPAWRKLRQELAGNNTLGDEPMLDLMCKTMLTGNPFQLDTEQLRRFCNTPASGFEGG